jgi:hypothetical protein
VGLLVELPGSSTHADVGSIRMEHPTIGTVLHTGVAKAPLCNHVADAAKNDYPELLNPDF